MKQTSHTIRGIAYALIGVPECTEDLDCNDGESCTTDYCDAGTCVNAVVPDQTVCDEGSCCDGVCSASGCNTIIACGGNKAICYGEEDCCSGACVDGRCRGN